MDGSRLLAHTFRRLPTTLHNTCVQDKSCTLQALGRSARHYTLPANVPAFVRWHLLYAGLSLCRHRESFGAGAGNRTRISSLEGWSIAVMLRPRKGRTGLSESSR